MCTQNLKGLIEVRITGFSGHRRCPVCEDVERSIGRILANSNLAHPERRPQFPMAADEQQFKLGSSLMERIGNTPLIRLDQTVRGLEGITLLGKAEWANPGGSVKDRAAAAMVRDALQ